MTIFRHLSSACLAACMLASPADAAQLESLDLLETRIVTTLGAGIGEPGGPAAPVDRRLKLAACTGTREIAVPRPATAVVRCTAPAWRIYVPLVPLPKAASGVEELAPAIRKGEQVDLVASGEGFTVSTVAVAEQDGMIGGSIRVRLAPRSTPLTVRVLGPGRAAIN